MPKPPPAFFRACDENGLDPDTLPLEAFERYLDHLLKVNEHCNLTAVRDVDDAWIRHIFDCLNLVPVINQGEFPRGAWVDVGSGGGLPGIVLALMYPDQAIHLIEATQKKCRFLEETSELLGLQNVAVVPFRAEEVGHDPDFREQFSLCFSRAVSAMTVLLELCFPLLQVGGSLIALKGVGIHDELSGSPVALHTLGAEAPQIVPVEYSGGAIVTVRKKQKVPRIYPRPPGHPKKFPLG